MKLEVNCGQWFQPTAFLRWSGCLAAVRFWSCLALVLAIAMGVQEFQGRYRLRGGVLRMEIEGNLAEEIQCQFPDPDTMRLTYPGGVTIEARRVPSTPEKPAPAPNVASPTSAATAASPASSLPATRPARLLMNRVEEPNERAFSVLVPQGWKTAAGSSMSIPWNGMALATRFRPSVISA